jgi:hypothetical protein
VVPNDGTVYLTGAGPSSEDKARAASVAGTMSGVGKVVTTVTVGPARSAIDHGNPVTHLVTWVYPR